LKTLLKIGFPASKTLNPEDSNPVQPILMESRIQEENGVAWRSSVQEENGVAAVDLQMGSGN
jgi:hypothetical protein